MPEAEARTRPPIDPEELAAFIDGRLEGERRQAMIARLAEDEDAYDLYDEVVRVREELAALEDDPAKPAVPIDVTAEAREPGRRSGTAKASVVPLPHRTGSPRPGWGTAGWLAMAAALAVAILAGWLILRPRGPVAGSSDLLARFDPATVGPRAAGAALETLGTVVRGSEPLIAELSAEERAAYFKLGVRAFDLALAAEAGETDLTRRRLEEIDRLLDDVPFSFVHEETYQELLRRFSSGESLTSLRLDVAAAEAELEAELDLPEQPYFAFGRWLEAVRIAAVMGDRRFLDSRAARRPLRHFLEVPPSPAVMERLNAVSRELERGAENANLYALRQELKVILGVCADGSVCFGSPDPI